MIGSLLRLADRDNRYSCAAATSLGSSTTCGRCASGLAGGISEVTDATEITVPAALPDLADPRGSGFLLGTLCAGGAPFNGLAPRPAAGLVTLVTLATLATLVDFADFG